MSVVIEVQRVLPGPPELVWDLLTDWEHQDEWMLEASDFIVTSAVREGVGVEAEATIAIGGLTTRDRVRVSIWEPPQRLGIDHLGWVAGTGVMSLAPLDDGTTLANWREEFRPPLGVLGRIGMRAYRPLMRRTFERDLRVLAGLVRARNR